MIIVVIETCHYYACPFDGEIEKDQAIIRDKFSGNNYAYHLSCFVEWLKERVEARERSKK